MTKITDNLKIKVTKNNGLISFDLCMSDIIDVKSRDSIVSYVKENMNMYKSDTLYNNLRFALGIVHKGSYVLDGDTVSLHFTTAEKYYDEVENVVTDKLLKYIEPIRSFYKS